MNAAMVLMTDKGVDGVSMSDIAARAGVSRGTVYNYFDSVHELMGALAAEMEAELAAEIEAVNEQAPDPALRVVFGMKTYLARASRDHDWGRFMARFALSYASLTSGISEYGLADIQAGVDAGRFHVPEDQRLATMAVLAGSTLVGMAMIVNGVAPFRFDEQVVTQALTVLGVDLAEAKRLARTPLPVIDRAPSAQLPGPVNR